MASNFAQCGVNPGTRGTVYRADKPAYNAC